MTSISGVSAVDLIPMYPGFGTHFVYAYVGTPPQRQSLVVDTTGIRTAFVCKECKTCGEHNTKTFDPALSSTFNNSACTKAVGAPTSIMPTPGTGMSSMVSLAAGGLPKGCYLSEVWDGGLWWRGKVANDNLRFGGVTGSMVHNVTSFRANIGCMTAVSKTLQEGEASGVLGLANSSLSLPVAMTRRKVKPLASKSFSICMGQASGVLTLGGYDSRVAPALQPIYAGMIKRSYKYYALSLTDITVISGFSLNIPKLSLPADKKGWNTEGKGFILDSVTTMTYLPEAIYKWFVTVLESDKSIGIKVVKKSRKFTVGPDFKWDWKMLPTFEFSFVGVDGQPGPAIPFSPKQYIIVEAKNTFSLSVMPAAAPKKLSNDGDGVLGQMFMQGSNIHFDEANKRVGFAAATCKYSDLGFQPTADVRKDEAAILGDLSSHKKGDEPNKPTVGQAVNPVFIPKATSQSGLAPEAVALKCSKMLLSKPLTMCTASCLEDEGAFEKKPKARVVHGTQRTSYTCPMVATFTGPNKTVVGDAPCSMTCDGTRIVRGTPSCYDSPWSQCTDACSQTRTATKIQKDSHSTFNLLASACTKTRESRTCSTGSCPSRSGDHLLFLDMKVNIPPVRWSYVYMEDFSDALSLELGLDKGRIRILNDVSEEWSASTKVHFEITLNKEDFDNSLRKVADAAELLPRRIRGPFFGDRVKSRLIQVEQEWKQLPSYSNQVTGEGAQPNPSDKTHSGYRFDFSKYGWLTHNDITVTSVSSMPVGGSRESDTVGIAKVPGFDYQKKDKSQHDVAVEQEHDREAFYVGGLIGAGILVLFVLFMFYRLARRHAELSKDKADSVTCGDVLAVCAGRAVSSHKGKMYTKVNTGVEMAEDADSAELSNDEYRY